MWLITTRSLVRSQPPLLSINRFRSVKGLAGGASVTGWPAGNLNMFPRGHGERVVDPNALRFLGALKASVKIHRLSGTGKVAHP